MALLSIARDYMVWHYGMAYVDGARIWWNYVWFVNHMFSIPDVLGSLFPPFKRLKEESPNILVDPEAFFSGIFVNIIMRIVGFTIRTALLVIALIMFLFTLCVGAAVLILWTLLPLFLVHFLIEGLRLLFA